MANITSYETAAGRRWEVRYRKPNGRRTRKRGFERRRDAEAWMAEHVVTAIATNSYVAPSAGAMTVERLTASTSEICASSAIVNGYRSGCSSRLMSVVHGIPLFCAAFATAMFSRSSSSLTIRATAFTDFAMSITVILLPV